MPDIEGPREQSLGRQDTMICRQSVAGVKAKDANALPGLVEQRRSLGWIAWHGWLPTPKEAHGHDLAYCPHWAANCPCGSRSWPNFQLRPVAPALKWREQLPPARAELVRAEPNCSERHPRVWKSCNSNFPWIPGHSCRDDRLFRYFLPGNKTRRSGLSEYLYAEDTPHRRVRCRKAWNLECSRMHLAQAQLPGPVESRLKLGVRVSSLVSYDNSIPPKEFPRGLNLIRIREYSACYSDSLP